MEKQLEDKLTAKTTLEEAHDRFLASQPTRLTAEERESIRALAADIPSLWAASTTTTVERQTIIRQLLDEIVRAYGDALRLFFLFLARERQRAAIASSIGW